MAGIKDYSSTASNNTSVGSINIMEMVMDLIHLHTLVVRLSQ